MKIDVLMLPAIAIHTSWHVQIILTVGLVRDGLIKADGTKLTSWSDETC